MTRTHIARGRYLTVAVVAILLVVAGSCQRDTIVDTPNYRGGATDCPAQTQVVICRASDANLTIYEHDLPEATEEGARATLNGSFAQTDLTVTYADLDQSGDERTDIVYIHDDTLPAGYLGLSYCEIQKSSSPDRCDQAFVFIDVAAMCADIAATTSGPCANHATAIRGLLCHETGHAVGLLHGTESAPLGDNSDPRLGCMQTNVPLTNHEHLLLGIQNANLNGAY